MEYAIFTVTPQGSRILVYIEPSLDVANATVGYLVACGHQVHVFAREVKDYPKGWAFVDGGDE